MELADKTIVVTGPTGMAGIPLFHLLMMRAGMAIDVNPDGARYNFIHDEDIVADLPVLLDQASVPGLAHATRRLRGRPRCLREERQPDLQNSNNQIISVIR